MLQLRIFLKLSILCSIKAVLVAKSPLLAGGKKCRKKKKLQKLCPSSWSSHASKSAKFLGSNFFHTRSGIPKVGCCDWIFLTPKWGSKKLSASFSHYRLNWWPGALAELDPGPSSWHFGLRLHTALPLRESSWVFLRRRCVLCPEKWSFMPTGSVWSTGEQLFAERVVREIVFLTRIVQFD